MCTKFNNFEVNISQRCPFSHKDGNKTKLNNEKRVTKL